MKSLLTRELVESLNSTTNNQFVESINEKVSNLVSNAINDISEKSPFVRVDKCVFLPVNEASTGAVAQLSQYSYFFGIENPQIATNSTQKKNVWKNFWREFRANWRIGRKKYKKVKVSNTNLQPADVGKYQLSDLRHDCFKVMMDYLDTSTILTEYPDHISIVGSEDFGTGVKVNIYICCYEEADNVFKLPYKNKNKFFDINFGQRFENIQSKIERCGKVVVDVLQVYNALYSRSYNKIPNQILLEGLIFNCPDRLFDNNDLYKTFVNVSNYIRICDAGEFVSPCDTNVKLFKEPIITRNSSQVDFSKIMAMIDRYKY